MGFGGECTFKSLLPYCSTIMACQADIELPADRRFPVALGKNCLLYTSGLDIRQVVQGKYPRHLAGTSADGAVAPAATFPLGGYWTELWGASPFLLPARKRSFARRWLDVYKRQARDLFY